jgi:putative FmdB family regulatory protein
VPLYEYQCRACQQQFELLVRTGDVPACPECQSADLERMLSMFGVTTPGGSQQRLQKARVDYKRSQKDKMIAAREERERHQH